MRTTIDAAGRIVVPKALRDQLGLAPGRELEVTAADDRLEIAIVPTEARLEEHDGVLVAVTAEELPTLSADQVRETLERVRR